MTATYVFSLLPISRSQANTHAQYECSAFIIDTWVDDAASGRLNIAPAKLPWDMLRTLIMETYGGKIDDEADFKQLTALVHSVLTPAAFEIDHKLVQGHTQDGEEGSLSVPAGTGMAQYMEWVNALPEREPPTYLGLPANAEKLLLVGQGRHMIGNLARITELLDEGDQLVADVGVGVGVAT